MHIAFPTTEDEKTLSMISAIYGTRKFFPREYHYKQDALNAAVRAKHYGIQLSVLSKKEYDALQAAR
jgi:hypothetical protein